jgi:hypothetical protein
MMVIEISRLAKNYCDGAYREKVLLGNGFLYRAAGEVLQVLARLFQMQ